LQMAYLFTPDAPRNCWALITVGNVFGLVPFRLTLMWLFGQLLLTLGKSALWSKACWVIGQLAVVASCVILLVNEYQAKPDEVFLLSKSVDCIDLLHSDYIWLLAIYMWLLPEPPQSSATNSVMQSNIGTKTAVGGRGSLLPDRRTSAAVQDTRKIAEESA
ncbi:hypothetical protein HDU86_007901, partial [Geranomyces michiganensis]